MSDKSSLVEKLIKSELIHNGRIVRLSVDTVQLPNGKQATREIVKHPGAVAVVPITTDGKIILVWQYRYAAGRVLLEIPAGTLKPGEDPDECVIRELQEETGYKPGKIEKLGGIFVAPGYTTEFIHLYLASNLSESRLDMDDDEFIEVEAFSMQEIMDKITSGEIADGKTISGIFLARERLGK